MNIFPRLLPKKKYLKTKMFMTSIFLGLVLASCSTPEEKAQDYVAKGMHQLEKGNIDKAKIEFKNALQIQKNLNDALFGLAMAFEKEGDWQKVYNLCLQVVEQEPKHVKAHIKLGYIYLASEKLDKAFETIKTLEALVQNNADVYALKASVLLKSGDTNGGLASARQALLTDPSNSEATTVLASERVAAGDYDKALEYVEGGLIKSPSNVALYLVKISILETANRIQEAEKVYSALIKQSPANLEYRKALAVFYLKHNQSQNAEDVLTQIVKDDPKSYQAKVDLISLVKATRGDLAAKGLLDEFIASAPDDVELKFAQVSLLDSMNQPQAALTVLNTIVKSSESKEELNKAKTMIASRYLLAGKTAEAVKMLDAVLQQDARYEPALLLKSSVEIQEKNYDSAIAHLRTILADSPFSSKALIALAQAHELSGSGELAEKHYQMAVDASPYDKRYVLPFSVYLLKHNQIDRAEKLVQNLASTSQNQTDVDVLNLLANIKMQKGDWLGAQEIANQIKVKAHNNELGDQLMGAALAGQKNFAESINAFKRSYDAAPSNPASMLALIRAYSTAGRNSEAIQFLDSVVKNNPGNANAQILLAKMYIKNNDKPKAINIYREIIQTNPALPDAYLQLSELLRDSGRLDDAENVANDGLKSIPDNPNLQFVLANIYETQKDFASAIKMYQLILRKFPHETLLINNYVSLVSDYSQDKEEMNRAYQLAQELNHSDSPYMQDTIGWISYKVGRYGEAVSALKMATSKAPNVAMMHYHLGLAQIGMVNKLEAKNAFEKALKLKKTGDELPEDEIKKLISQL